MTNEQKIENFKKRAMAKAQIEANELKFEYQASYQVIVQDFVARARKKADIKYKAQKEVFVKSKNKTIAEAKIKARKKVGVHSDELQKKIFDGVRKKIDAFMKTPEYNTFLIQKINEAVASAKGREMILYINASDSEKKEVLEKTTGAVLTISNLDFIGGIRAVIGERFILIDESFETKLEEENDKFIFSVGGSL